MHARSLLSAFTVGAALVLSAATAHAQNLLTNGNMDATSISGQVLATPTGWTAGANKSVSGAFSDGMSSEGFANVLDPAGNGVFFKAFQGTITPSVDKLTASLTQTVPATAGMPYTLTGWAGAGAGFIGLSDPTVGSQFTMEFLNGANAVIGSSTLDLKAAGLGSGAPTAPATGFGYHLYSLSALAPAGTASVRVGTLLSNAYGNPAGGDQAFVVDAFSLTVPEPTTLAAAAGGLLMLARRRRA